MAADPSFLFTSEWLYPIRGKIRSVESEVFSLVDCSRLKGRVPS